MDVTYMANSGVPGATAL